MSKTPPRIWIGCLACYEEGHLAGEWFKAIDAPTHPQGFTEKLRRAPFGHGIAHDELWVMDHEGYEGLLSGEFSPQEGVRVAQLIQALQAENLDPVAVGRWVRHEGKRMGAMVWEEISDEFHDAYAGRYDDLGAYSADMWEGSEFLEQLPDEILQNIDWQSIGNDAELNGTIYTIGAGDGGVHVFTR